MIRLSWKWSTDGEKEGADQVKLVPNSIWILLPDWKGLWCCLDLSRLGRNSWPSKRNEDQFLIWKILFPHSTIIRLLLLPTMTIKSHVKQKFIQAVKGLPICYRASRILVDIFDQTGPALANQRDLYFASQKYLSSQYASDKDKWGTVLSGECFSCLGKEQGLVSNDLEDKGFTNELVGDWYFNRKRCKFLFGW